MTKKILNKKLPIKVDIFDQVTQIMNNAADEQDLLAINRWIITRLKAIRVSKSMTAAATLKAGMNVEWTGRNGFQRGVVIKVNRTRAKVKVTGPYGDEMIWNVPMNMINIIK